MKTQRFCIFFCSLVILFEGFSATTDCDQMPAGASTMCCSLPSFKDIAVIESIVGHYSTKKMDDYMMECVMELTIFCDTSPTFVIVENFTKQKITFQKINEELAKELNIVKNGQIDMEMALKRIDNSFDKPSWRKVYRDGLIKCLGKVNGNFNEIQKKFATNPFNIEKSKCDIKFMAVFFCIQMDAYINCPEDESVKTKECEDVMLWMRTCHRDAYSFREVASGMKTSK